jgi:hypothetical protein
MGYVKDGHGADYEQFGKYAKNALGEQPSEIGLRPNPLVRASFPKPSALSLRP